MTNVGGLTLKANALLAWSLLALDGADGVVMSGSPPSALRTLCTLTGKQRANVRRALLELRAHGIVVTSRAGVHGPLRIHVVRSAVAAIGVLCVTCTRPTRGAGRWCPDCKQKYRSDRAWQQDAEQLHRAGHSPLTIAGKLDRPMYVASAEDGRNANGGAVVPYLIGKGLLGEEWAERLREAERGGVDE